MVYLDRRIGLFAGSFAGFVGIGSWRLVNWRRLLFCRHRKLHGKK